jgi:outer membrane protein assembly factor BamA
VLLGLVSAIAFAATAFSQTTTGSSDSLARENELLSFEGQIVSSIEVAGRPDLQTEELRQLIPIHAGERFSHDKADEAIAVLKRATQLETIQLDLRPEIEGVRVIFILQPAFYVGLYQFPGAERFPYGLLLQVSNFSSQEPYSSSDINKAKEGLQTHFRRNGYFRSEINVEVQPDKIHRLANVNFNTALGPRAKFGNVVIEGTSPEETIRMQKFLRSFRARIQMAAVRPGRTYSLTTLQNAIRHLESRLANDKHPVVQVKLTGAEYNPNTNKADVTFNVQRGPVIQATVEGAKLSRRVQRELLPVYQEGILSPELIQEGRKNLMNHFRNKGYFNVRVDATIAEKDEEQKVIYQITRGSRKRIKRIEFTGNRHFRDEELRHHVTASQARLSNRGRYDEASIDQLTAFYQSMGFRQVNVRSEFIPATGRDLIVTFVINEGPQDVVADVQVTGNSVPIAQLVPGGLQLGPGKPFSQSAAERDRSTITSSYLDLGYLTATVHQTSRPLSSDQEKFQVLYEISEGPRVVTSSVVTLGRDRTKQTLIDKDTANFRPGAPLTESGILASEQRLFARGVFDWAQVNLRRRIASQEQEDVIVKVHEAKRNNILYGIGFEVTNRQGNVPEGTVAVTGLPALRLPSTFRTNQETFAGPRGTFQYTRSNVRGRAETVTVGALYGPLERTAQFDFVDPQFRWTKWNAALEVLADYNKLNPIATTRQALATFQLERPLDEKKRQDVILRYSFSRINLSDLAIPELVPPEDRNTRLSTFSAVYVRDTRDNAVDVSRGMYGSFEVNANPRGFGSSASFTRLLGQAAYYREVRSGLIWANSIRAGLLVPARGQQVPLSQRFFTGGASTLRGFPLNGAGPQNAVPVCSNPSDPSTCSLIEVPDGGLRLLIVNSEFRIPLPIKKGLGLVAFYDGGNVFHPSPPNHAAHFNYTNSIGLGIRYKTPIGPIRVDVGHNLNPVPGINPTQLFITLGQAF